MCRIFVYILLLLFAVPLLHSQENTPFYLKNTDWLQQKDAKKWEKLVGQIPDADKLIQQSNECYLQVAAIETESSDKTKQKQVTKLEKQSAEYYKQALIKYKDIYQGLYAVLSDNIDEAAKTHPAYTDMLHFNSQAEELYAVANDLSDEGQRGQFSQANEFLLAAVEKGVSVFNVPQSAYVNNIGGTTNEPAVSDDIVINPEFYRKYKEYVEKYDTPDPFVIGQLLQTGSSYAGFEEYKEMWNKFIAYEEGKEAVQVQIEQAIKLDSTGESSPILPVGPQLGPETTVQTEPAIHKDEVSKSIIIPESGLTENLEIASTPEETTQKTEIKTQKKPITEGLFVPDISFANDLPEYRVQLAASRSPLNMQQVMAIYKGPLSVVESNEGDLYKYQIRSFTLYTDAQRICSQSGVENAYLVSYSGGLMVDLAEAIKQTQAVAMQVKKLGKEKVLHEIEFSVQVAASRVRLTALQLSEIYSARWPLTVVFEGGWYKYQILAGKSMQQALDVLENCGVEKAFLTASKNGRKLLLYKALHEYKSYAL
ncbi:MAG: hypothetical protein JXB34_03660 [Bacteroidales bacterium]|nr:hypothetical protein [Bacteroidales bacterium]